MLGVTSISEEVLVDFQPLIPNLQRYLPTWILRMLKGLERLGGEICGARFFQLSSFISVHFPINPYVFASIVFHVEFIEKEFAPDHPLFHTRIFTGGYMNHYRGRILLGIASCPLTGDREHFFGCFKFRGCRFHDLFTFGFSSTRTYYLFWDTT